MKRFRVGLLALAIMLVAYTGLTTFPTGNQLLARGDIEALVGNAQLAWSSADPAWGTSNAQLVTYSDFTTWVKNNGSCGGSSLQIISSTAAQACRILYTYHSTSFTGHSASESYVCSFNGTTLVGTCTAGNTTTTDDTITLNAGTQPPSSGTPMVLSLNTISYTSACTTPNSFTLTLKNPANTTVYGPTTFTGTANVSVTQTSGSGAAGAWYWVVHLPVANITCAANIAAAGTYTESVNFAGSHSEYY